MSAFGGKADIETHSQNGALWNIGRVTPA
jgi:hypothetical protein